MTELIDNGDDQYIISNECNNDSQFINCDKIRQTSFNDRYW
jgi:hypothetical protein